MHMQHITFVKQKIHLWLNTCIDMTICRKCRPVTFIQRNNNKWFIIFTSCSIATCKCILNSRIIRIISTVSIIIHQGTCNYMKIQFSINLAIPLPADVIEANLFICISCFHLYIVYKFSIFYP